MGRGGLNVRNLTLKSVAPPNYKDVRSALWFTASSVKHHSETHIIANTVMNKRKGLMAI